MVDSFNQPVPNLLDQYIHDFIFALCSIIPYGLGHGSLWWVDPSSKTQSRSPILFLPHPKVEHHLQKLVSHMSNIIWNISYKYSISNVKHHLPMSHFCSRPWGPDDVLRKGSGTLCESLLMNQAQVLTCSVECLEEIVGGVGDMYSVVFFVLYVFGDVWCLFLFFGLTPSYWYF